MNPQYPRPNPNPVKPTSNPKRAQKGPKGDWGWHKNLEVENTIEEPDDDDSVIGDQLADACDQLIPVQTNAKARELNPSSALASAVVMALHRVP